MTSRLLIDTASTDVKSSKRKNRWLQEDLAWLEEGDVPADPLGDLVTTSNELSVWLIEDDKSNLERILTAYAATRDTAAHVDYALFAPQLLSEIGILPGL